METLIASDAGMFGMFRFGPTWAEALCMFDGNLIGSDAGMFRMFRLGPTWEEALCMFDRNFVEATPACFVETASQPCLAVCHWRMLPVSRIAARYLPERLYARTMHLNLAVLALTYCRRVCLC